MGCASWSGPQLPMLKVLITVDTEVWPVAHGWPHTPLGPTADCTRELAAYFEGGGPNGPGLSWQLAQFDRTGLKATYFVDPMFSFALGLAPLQKVVKLVQSQGQEVGLHVHPEWITDERCPRVAPFRGPYLASYPEHEQTAIIEVALRRLREAGAIDVRSFRAGSWGADAATLRALCRNGIAIDSSLNPTFARSYPDLAARETYNQPARIEGVWVVPVTTFVDRPPTGLRPLHVCASSFDEMRSVLEHAVAAEWFAVVIVLHCFEFVRVDRLARGARVTPQRLLSRRFEHLCDYLAAHPARYQPSHFADLAFDLTAALPQRPRPLSTRDRTLFRVLQQIASRVF